MCDLSGRSAVVTGGADGIGLGIAAAFARHGATVVVLDTRDPADFDPPEAGTAAPIRYFQADVSDARSVAAAFTDVRSHITVVDILVNNAGVVSQFEVADMPVAEWDRILAVNLRGPFLCTREVIGPMVAQRWGRIINMASQLGQIGGETMAHYSASKAGLIGFTKSLAREVSAHNVLVNAIAPGPIETAMLASETEQWRSAKLASLPMGRFGQVEEVVPTALFLASEAASYYVGQTLGPNGGDVTP